MLHAIIPRHFHLKKITLTEKKLRSLEDTGQKKCHHLHDSYLTDNKTERVYPLKQNKMTTTTK